MNTNIQRFTNNVSAVATSLRSIPWIDQYHPTAGALGLANKDLREGIPSCIADTSRQPAVLEHPLNVQAFRSDDAVSVNQGTGDLMMEVAASIAHLRVKVRHSRFHLLSTIAAASTSSQSPLLPSQLRERSLKALRVAKRFTIRRCDERPQANVDAHRAGSGWSCNVGGLNTKNDEPLAIVAKDADVLRRSSRQCAVPSHANSADIAQPQLAIDNLPALAIAARCPQAERVEAIFCSKSRIARITTLFNGVYILDSSRRDE